MKPPPSFCLQLSRLFSLLIIVLGLFVPQVSAQELSIGQELTKKNFYVISQVNEGEVVLRWAPVDANLWQHLNAVGYHVDRLKVPETPQQSPPSFERLTEAPVRPWPAADWEGLVEEDDNARRCLHDHLRRAPRRCRGHVPANEEK